MHIEITNKEVPLYVATLARDHPSYEATISENKLCIIIFTVKPLYFEDLII